jgi:hypothetical protein
MESDIRGLKPSSVPCFDAPLKDGSSTGTPAIRMQQRSTVCLRLRTEN